MSQGYHDRKRHFASDNYAGICPEAWQAMQEANASHTQSYGSDPWTKEACDLIRQTFDCPCKVFFVFNGTAANALALSSICDSFHSVICHRFAHIETDECGAPGLFSHGTTLVTLDSPQGKLTPDAIHQAYHRRNDIHYPRPRAVTLTQSTELGTVYSAEEVLEIGNTCKKLGIHLHMDGARFANAVASLNVHPKEITWKAGVDVVSFGGTKNGMSHGEAVVFFNPTLANEFDYRCKQAGQLASKMRFISAQWIGLLKDGAWLRNAQNANLMAEKLETKIKALKGATILFPRQANAVFVDLSEPQVQALHQNGWHFYTDVGPGGARLMCSWDSQEEEIDALVEDIRKIC
jgi:threonine aldolase